VMTMGAFHVFIEIAALTYVLGVKVNIFHKQQL
jgi:hypothetical protein